MTTATELGIDWLLAIYLNCCIGKDPGISLAPADRVVVEPSDPAISTNSSASKIIVRNSSGDFLPQQQPHSVDSASPRKILTAIEIALLPDGIAGSPDPCGRTSGSTQQFNMQASQFRTTAQSGGRKKIKVPGWIEMNPRIPEITMAVAGKIGSNNNDFAARPQNAPAFAKQADRIRSVFNYVTERHRVQGLIGQLRLGQSVRDDADGMSLLGKLCR